MSDLTVSAVLGAFDSIASGQLILNQACTECFTGKNVKVAKKAILHETLVAMVALKEEFNAANKGANDIIRANAKLNGIKTPKVAKYQGFNMLATEINRWINKVNTNPKYNGLRASIKATGPKGQWSIALVQSAKAGDDASPSKSPTAEKKIGDLTCAQAIAFLVKEYGAPAVKQATANL